MMQLVWVSGHCGTESCGVRQEPDSGINRSIARSGPMESGSNDLTNFLTRDLVERLLSGTGFWTDEVLVQCNRKSLSQVIDSITGTTPRAVVSAARVLNPQHIVSWSPEEGEQRRTPCTNPRARQKHRGWWSMNVGDQNKLIADGGQETSSNNSPLKNNNNNYKSALL